jgi:hypothetical protein
VRCTKETIDDRVSSAGTSNPVTESHQPGGSFQSSSFLVSTDRHHSQQEPDDLRTPLSHSSEFKRRPSTKLILDRFSLIDALIAAYEAENAEAEEILLDMITPPSFEEKLSCHSCERPFSITLFRHHCRHCGKTLPHPPNLLLLPHSYVSGNSFCREHSNSTRSIPKYGFPDLVRVCKSCEVIIDQEVADLYPLPSGSNSTPQTHVLC